MNVFLQFILGILIADIISGFFHWLEDSYLTYCNRIPILKKIAEFNHGHHFYPRDILTTNGGNQAVVGTAIIVVIVLIIRPSWYTKYPILILTTLAFIALSGYIHKLVHYQECERPLFLGFLQRVGVMCSHEQHRKHHENGDSNYCIILAVTNVILDSTRVWACLEWLIKRATGIKAQRLPYGMYMHIRDESDNKKIITNDSVCTAPVDNAELQKYQEKLRGYYGCTH